MFCGTANIDPNDKDPLDPTTKAGMLGGPTIKLPVSDHNATFPEVIEGFARNRPDDPVTAKFPDTDTALMSVELDRAAVPMDKLAAVRLDAAVNVVHEMGFMTVTLLVDTVNVLPNCMLLAETTRFDV